MRLPERAAPAAPLAWLRLLRVAGAGLVCALIVLMAGRLAERGALGSDEAEARARVEADVRGSFDAMARSLRLMALGMADPASVVAASQDDTTAARRLFAAANA